MVRIISTVEQWSSELKKKDGVLYLTELETKVFLTLMDRGPGTVSDISSRMHRDSRPEKSTIRNYCKAFEKEGLVHQKGNWRKCEAVIYALKWHDMPKGKVLSVNAQYSPFRNFHQTKVRPSLEGAE